jgi:hypothetical protein
MERTLGGFGAFNPADRKSLDTVPTVTRPPGHHATTPPRRHQCRPQL